MFSLPTTILSSSAILLLLLLLLSSYPIPSICGPNDNTQIIDIRYGAWHELGRGISTDENLQDKTGYAISSSAEGNILAIGSPEYEKHKGRVRVYQYNELTDQWKKVGSDIVGEVSGDQSGYSVALSITGDYLAVGSPFCSKVGLVDGIGKNDIIKKEVGCVKIYERSTQFDVEGSDRWEQLGETLTGVDSFDHFGYSLAVNDIYTDVENEDLDMIQVAIGAPGAKNALDEAVGRVYMKELVVDGSTQWIDASENSYDQQAYVGEGTAGSRFGSAVSISIDDDLMLVGAPKANNKVSDELTVQNAGAVFLFERKRDTTDNVQRWRKIDGLTRYGDDEGDECGTSVSMTLRGTYIALGCPFASFYDSDDNFVREAGLVEVYKIIQNQVSNTWTKVDVSLEDLLGASTGDFFGYSVSIGEDAGFDQDNIFLAVGAPNSYPSAIKQKAGHVRVFHLKGDEWRRANLDIDGNSAFDEMGTSVSISYDGHRVFSGAPGQSGYASAYELKYTDPPTVAPTLYPTKRSNGKNPTNNRPHDKMDDLIYDTNKRYASPYLLSILILILIPAVLFLAFRGYLYYRGRRHYTSEFGSDVQVASTSDLELARSTLPNSTSAQAAAQADII